MPCCWRPVTVEPGEGELFNYVLIKKIMDKDWNFELMILELEVGEIGKGEEEEEKELDS